MPTPPLALYQYTNLGNLCLSTAVIAQFLNNQSAHFVQEALPMISISLVSISLIGVAIALLVCALLAKLFSGESKANKAQRAEIIKRLLALAEDEKRRSGAAASIRLRPPLPAPGSHLSYGPSIRTHK
jgi:phosphate/sulfate permease